MQYRYEREQSEPIGTCEPAPGRTVEINMMKRLKQYGAVREVT